MNRLLAVAAAFVTAAAFQMSAASAPAFAAPGQGAGVRGLASTPGVSQRIEVGRRFGGGGGMRSFGGGGPRVGMRSFGGGGPRMGVRSFGPGRSFSHRRFDGVPRGNFNRYAYRGGNWNGRRFHRHRNRFWYGAAFAAVPYYYYNDYGYGYDDCHYLKRRAIRTGSSYWWRRYEQCRYDY